MLAGGLKTTDTYVSDPRILDLL